VCAAREKKLETDRRRIRDRVGKIQTSIDAVRKQRALRREARNAVPLGTIALVVTRRRQIHVVQPFGRSR